MSEIRNAYILVGKSEGKDHLGHLDADNGGKKKRVDLDEEMRDNVPRWTGNILPNWATIRFKESAPQSY
jgi:hypothetical protein